MKDLSFNFWKGRLCLEARKGMTWWTPHDYDWCDLQGLTKNTDWILGYELLKVFNPRSNLQYFLFELIQPWGVVTVPDPRPPKTPTSLVIHLLYPLTRTPLSRNRDASLPDSQPWTILNHHPGPNKNLKKNQNTALQPNWISFERQHWYQYFEGKLKPGFLTIL